jgi:hypothetical protein
MKSGLDADDRDAGGFGRHVCQAKQGPAGGRPGRAVPGCAAALGRRRRSPAEGDVIDADFTMKDDKKKKK